jgi:hypothetical protein
MANSEPGHLLSAAFFLAETLGSARPGLSLGTTHDRVLFFPQLLISPLLMSRELCWNMAPHSVLI